MLVFYAMTTGQDAERPILVFYCRDAHGVMDEMGVPMLGSACELLVKFAAPYLSVQMRTNDVKGSPELRDDVTAVSELIGNDDSSHVYFALSIQADRVDFLNEVDMQAQLKALVELVWLAFCRRHSFLNGALLRNTGLVRLMNETGVAGSGANTNNL